MKPARLHLQEFLCHFHVFAIIIRSNNAIQLFLNPHYPGVDDIFNFRDFFFSDIRLGYFLYK